MHITKALLAEHAVFHNLFDHVDRLVPTLTNLDEVKILGRLVSDMMEDHSAVEDELLIAPLEHCLAQLGQEENFHQEHQQIDSLLEEIARTATLSAASVLLV